MEHPADQPVGPLEVGVDVLVALDRTLNLLALLAQLAENARA